MENIKNNIEQAKTPEVDEARFRSIGRGLLGAVSEEKLDAVIDGLGEDVSDEEAIDALMGQIRQSLVERLKERRAKKTESVAEVEEFEFDEVYPKNEGESDADYTARVTRIRNFGDLMAKTPRIAGESEEEYQSRIFLAMGETGNDRPNIDNSEQNAEQGESLLQKGIFDLAIAGEASIDNRINSKTPEALLTGDNLGVISLDDAGLTERLEESGLSGSAANLSRVKQIVSNWNQMDAAKREEIYEIDGHSFDAGDDKSWMAGTLRVLGLVA